MASLNTYEFEPRPLGTLASSVARSPGSVSKMVRQARKGDRESFDALVGSHRDSLRSFLLNRVEAGEVDDVIQDVFVAAWRALPQYDGRSQFRTWLFAIAFNKVRDHYRQRMRRVTEVHLPSGEPSLAQAADPFAAKDLSIAVRELVDGLSDSQREVILLYYQDGLTLAEIGTVLSRNLSTVKYQFFQAHSKLADQIRESPDWSTLLAPNRQEAKR